MSITENIIQKILLTVHEDFEVSSEDLEKIQRIFNLIDSKLPQVTAVSDNTGPVLSKTFGRILGFSSTSIKPLP